MELKHFLPMNIRKPQIWENYTYFLKHTNVHGGPVSSDYGVLTEKVSKFLKPRPQPFMQCGSPHQGKQPFWYQQTWMLYILANHKEQDDRYFKKHLRRGKTGRLLLTDLRRWLNLY